MAQDFKYRPLFLRTTNFGPSSKKFNHWNRQKDGDVFRSLSRYSGLTLTSVTTGYPFSRWRRTSRTPRWGSTTTARCGVTSEAPCRWQTGFHPYATPWTDTSFWTGAMSIIFQVQMAFLKKKLKEATTSIHQAYSENNVKLNKCDWHFSRCDETARCQAYLGGGCGFRRHQQFHSVWRLPQRIQGKRLQRIYVLLTWITFAFSGIPSEEISFSPIFLRAI